MSTMETRGAPRIKAAGHAWRAELADDGGHPVVLFFCVTSDQRPYRVVAVEAGRYVDAAALAAAPEEELRALFEASGSMGVPVEYPTYGAP